MDERPKDETQTGVVSRLNWDAGLGYVRTDDGRFQFIFVVGKTLPNREARKLTVGQRVRFRLSAPNRVAELVAD